MACAPRLVLLALVTVLLAAAPAAAHLPEHTPVVVPLPALTETITAAAPEPAVPWVALASLAAIALVSAWRPRRVIALVLVLVAAVFAFEAGVHSTHHLGQRDDARHCVVAGISAQLSADLVDTTVAAGPAAVVQHPFASCTTPDIAARSVAPDAGRAPPIFSA